MSDHRETILKVQGLKQYFKSGFGKNKIVVKAVDDVSFEIKKGEVFSLVGESGCGKTTTGRTIIKLYKSSGGEVFFHDTRILSDVKEAKRAYKETTKNLKQELGDMVYPLICDFNDDLQINSLIEEAEKEFGNIDILVCNAGITKDNLALRLKDEDWDMV